MPNIIEYSAPTQLAPSPGNRASESHALAARRIDIEYNKAGAAYQLMGHELGKGAAAVGNAVTDYIAHKEISEGGLAATSLLLDQTNKWSDATRDPNAIKDPSLQGRYMENLEGRLQKFKDSFITEKGQEWAERHVERIRDHFAHTTTADMSTIAGINAHNAFTQSVNMLSTLVDKDPASIDMAASQLKEHVKDTLEHTPNLKGTSAARFQVEATQKGMEAIVKAAVQSAIRKGTDGSEIANDPKYAPYISGPERSQMVQWQRREEAFQRADERAQRQAKKQEEQEKGEDSLGQIVRGLNGERPEEWGRDRINKMFDDGQLPEKYYEHAINVLDRLTKEETPARISKENERELMRRIRLPEGDPQRITNQEELWQAYTNKDPDKQIDYPALARTINILNDFGTPEMKYLKSEVHEFEKAFSPQLNKTAMGSALDPRGAERLKYFMDGLWRNIEVLRAQGVPTREIMHRLLDPTSKDYYGTQENVDKWISQTDKMIREAIPANPNMRKRIPLDDITPKGAVPLSK